ncbi:addiction module protein [Synoicihabitans lomoniglobus]|uniref:Addiction module protein n=1 Tax=Synoicihabitans lomoniglobus TaxID=2909285 RepID=A0AAF0CPB4_9BACT|nr:addiction module protein [Opitutaceae bacterium LMO-M01]WED63859.1 addiction module protein [Opitutaceae bacterium LMO-M01]
MPLPEKLELMEKLWVEISEEDKNVETPSWHKHLLDERTSRVEEGSAKFIAWKDAKAQLERDCQ